jgi:hypothetical protein
MAIHFFGGFSDLQMGAKDSSANPGQKPCSTEHINSGVPSDK